MIAVVVLCVGCYDRDRKADKEKLLGNDYRLFQDTPVWGLAKAVQDEDTSLIVELAKVGNLEIDYQEAKFGNTLLVLAIKNDDYKSVKALLELGANPNISDHYRGSTPMHDAAENKDPKYLRILLEYKGNPNVVESMPVTENDRGRTTPLNEAISYSSDNNLEKVKLLVEAGADINFYNKWYSYYPHLPISDAIIHSKLDIALYLLEQGADYTKVMYTTVQGDSIYILGALRRTIVDLGSEAYRYKKEVISFLKERGLDYDKEPIPDYIVRDIKKKYPKNWEEYLEKY